MGQGQSGEELRDRVQGELGAFFVHPHPPPSSSRYSPNINLYSSCISLVDQIKLESWTGKETHESDSQNVSISTPLQTRFIDNLLHKIDEDSISNDIDSEKSPSDPTEPKISINESIYSFSFATAEGPTNSQFTRRSKLFEESTIDQSILEMKRPIVVQHVPKYQKPRVLLLSNDLEGTKHQIIIESAVKLFDLSHYSTQSPQKPTNPESVQNNEKFERSNADVTVREYLGELDLIAKPGRMDERCRFVSHVPTNIHSHLIVGNQSSKLNENNMTNEVWSSNDSFDRYNTLKSYNTSSQDLNCDENLIRHILNLLHISILSPEEIAEINQNIKNGQDNENAQLEHKPESLNNVVENDSEISQNESNQQNNNQITQTKTSPQLDEIALNDQTFWNHGSSFVGRAKAAVSHAVPHPNLVYPLKIIETPQSFFILQPYHRFNLETIFRFSPAVLDNEDKRLFTAYQLLRILHFLHQQGIVHGDLVPSNVQVSQRLWIMLSGIQFGNNMKRMKIEDGKIKGLNENGSEQTTATKNRSRNHSRKHSRSNSKTYDVLPESESPSMNHSSSDVTSTQKSTIQTLLQYSPLDNKHPTLAWIEGNMSNFDYLLKLNEWAGRTQGDPNFHPVMPWVIDFTCDPSITPFSHPSWRDLTKSKFRLNKGDEQLDFTFANPIPASMSKSTSATSGSTSASSGASGNKSKSPPSREILTPYHINDTLTNLTYYNYFARRTPLCLLRKYVRSNFQPNEYPGTMERLYSWTPDECIPEFYCDAEIFESLHPEMADLAVPVWASKGSTKQTREDVLRFLTIHREALESEHVSKMLHHWIDLTFGYKLSGEAGKQAKNVALLEKGSHRNHGFVQLFNMPHPPKRRNLNQNTNNAPQQPQKIYVGSNSGITSSFTSAPSPTQNAASASHGSRKAARPQSVMMTSPVSGSPTATSSSNPIASGSAPTNTSNTLQNPAASNSTSTPTSYTSPFSLLPKIVMNRQASSTNFSSQQQSELSFLAFSGEIPKPEPLSAILNEEPTPNFNAASKMVQENQTPAPLNITPHSTPSKDSPPLSHSGPVPGGVAASTHQSSSTVSHNKGRTSLPSPAETSTIAASTASHSKNTGPSPTATPTSKPGKEKSSLRKEFPQLFKFFGSISEAVSSSNTVETKEKKNQNPQQPGNVNQTAVAPPAAQSTVTPQPSNQTPSTWVASSPADLSPRETSQDDTSQSSTSKGSSTTTATTSTPHSIGLETEVDTPTTSLGKPLLEANVGPVAVPLDDFQPFLNPASDKLSSLPVKNAPETTKYRANVYIDDLLNNEYLSRFLLQVAPLDPIYHAPFDVYPPSNTSDERAIVDDENSAYGSYSDLNLSSEDQNDDNDVNQDEFYNNKKEETMDTLSDSQTDFDRLLCADLFSAGCLIYQIFTGSVLFHSKNISLYEEGDGIAWWHAARQNLSRRIQPLVFHLVMAGQPYARTLKATYDYYHQSNVNEESIDDEASLEEESDVMNDPFDFGMASVPMQINFKNDKSTQSSIENKRNQYQKSKNSVKSSSGSSWSPQAQSTLHPARKGKDSPLSSSLSDLNALRKDSMGSARDDQDFEIEAKETSNTSQQSQSPTQMSNSPLSTSFGTSEGLKRSSTSIDEQTIAAEYAKSKSNNNQQRSSPRQNVTQNNRNKLHGNNSESESFNLNQNNRKRDQKESKRFLSSGVLSRCLASDLSPFSMKIFPPYFELVYQFLCRYHSCDSWLSKCKYSLSHIFFLVNLPMAGFQLILPDLLVFFDHDETLMDALSFVDPLAIKLGRTRTIELMLDPIISLYENHSSNVPLYVEILGIRFVHTLLAKMGQACFLKHIVGFLVNSVRMNTPEIGFAAGGSLLRLISVLSPPVYIRYILYPLLAQVNKTNTEILSQTLVEIGARLGEDVIVRHHLEVLIPLLQKNIFAKDNAISVRTSITILKLIENLTGLLSPSRLMSALVVEHTSLFAILLNPPTDRALFNALIDCLTSITSSIGLHNAIKFVRPYLQQFFLLYAPIPTASQSPVISHATNNPSVAGLLSDSTLKPATQNALDTSIKPILSKGLSDTVLPSIVVDSGASRSHDRSKSNDHNIGESVHMGSSNQSVNASNSNSVAVSSNIASSNSSSSSSSSSNAKEQESETIAVYRPLVFIVSARFKEVLDIRSGGGNVLNQGLGSSTRIEGYLMGPPGSPVASNSPSPSISPRRPAKSTEDDEKTDDYSADAQDNDSNTELNGPQDPTKQSEAGNDVSKEEAGSQSKYVSRLASSNEDGHVADVMPAWLISLPMAPNPNNPGNPHASVVLGARRSMAPTTAAALNLNPNTQSNTTMSNSNLLPTPTGHESLASSTSSAPGIANSSNLLGPSPSSGFNSATSTNTSSGSASSFNYLPFNSNTFSTLTSPWPPVIGPQQTWTFSGHIYHAFKEHSSAIRCIAIHDNERLFVSGSKDSVVKCWDLLSQDSSSKQTYSGHKLPISDVEFVDRGNLIASCDGSIHVWELERGTRLTQMEHAVGSYSCFSSHQDGRVLVSGTSQSTITFTDLRAEQDVQFEWFLPNAQQAGIPKAISVNHFDQNLMCVGQASGHITLIDIRSGLLLHHWRAHDAAITELKPVPDYRGYLVSCSQDKTIALWDIDNAATSSPNSVTLFKGHTDPNISFDLYKGTIYSVSGQKISVTPLFDQPPVLALERRKLVKTNALKLTTLLTTFNILPSHQLSLIGSDDGVIKVVQ